MTSGGTDPDFIIAAARRWASEHRPFLEVVFGGFDASGVWPDIRKLQRELARSGESISLRDEATQLPGFLGAYEPNSGTAILNVLALSMCPAAHDVLSGFMCAVRFIVERYLSLSDGDFTSAELRSHLALPDELWRKVDLVLRNEYVLGGGQYFESGEWSLAVSDDTNDFLRATTLDDYLRVQVARFPLLPHDLARKCPVPRGSLRRYRSA